MQKKHLSNMSEEKNKITKKRIKCIHDYTIIHHNGNTYLSKCNKCGKLEWNCLFVI